MTQQEKDRQHIKKQNRRLRRLLFRVLAPVLVIQLFCLPLYLNMYLLYNAEPVGPKEIVYTDCHWESGRHTRTHLMIKTQDAKQFFIRQRNGRPFWEAVQEKQIVSGDTLNVSTITWPFYDRIVSLRAGDRVFFDLSDFEESRKSDIHLRLTICALALGGSLLGSLLVFAFERREFREIRKLKAKYKARLNRD